MSKTPYTPKEQLMLGSTTCRALADATRSTAATLLTVGSRSDYSQARQLIDAADMFDIMAENLLAISGNITELTDPSNVR